MLRNLRAICAVLLLTATLGAQTQLSHTQSGLELADNYLARLQPTAVPYTAKPLNIPAQPINWHTGQLVSGN